MPAEERDAADWAALTAATSEGWLKQVRLAAWTSSERDRFARVWFVRFLDASGDEEAYAAFELFLSAIDGRAGRWIGPLTQARPQLSRARSAHLRANNARLNSRSKRIREELKGCLYATTTKSESQALWD